ncbi:hypothetical protein CB0940_02592 [Lecanosticta acicola]|uniref:Uncharacterized protein n=1 Tax=Lecanosticta acicola TaxID=111012 RepID=A0AAI8YX87_9PEZI|nr:hypothetical protein CB0940_02592 [Lecanosticta acicola]
MAMSAVNGTGGSLASAAMESVKRRIEGESGPAAAATVPNAINGFEWLRSVLEKRHFRIPCVDIIVRL